MTRRTVARGPFTMAQDIGQRDVVIDFSNRVVGDPAPMDGTDVFLIENPPDTAVHTWEERDGRTVLAISEQGVPSNPIWYQGLGVMAPSLQSREIITITALVYIENAEGSIEIVPNLGTIEVMVAATTVVGNRKVSAHQGGFNPWGTTTADTTKDLYGWVWMKVQSDFANTTVRAKGWNDGDDEPIAWDAEAVITRQYVHTLPFGRSIFWTIGMHPYSEPFVTEIAQVSWRHE